MDIFHKVIWFYSDGNKLQGDLYHPLKTKKSPGILFLHGGKNLMTNRFEEWQKFLCVSGYASLSFHFRGAGKSEGRFEDGSLKNRLIDAFAAFEVFKKLDVIDANNIALEGSSMGAHIAIRLIEKIPSIKALILQSAAAYGIEAEDKNLNNSFKAVITKENNWFSSPIFKILKDYTGKVLIIYGELDNVIPLDVMRRYRASIKKGNYVIIKSGKHTLLRPQNKEEIQARSELFKQSLRFLNQYLK